MPLEGTWAGLVQYSQLTRVAFSLLLLPTYLQYLDTSIPGYISALKYSSHPQQEIQHIAPATFLQLAVHLLPDTHIHN